jgi:hypothetical protein
MSQLFVTHPQVQPNAPTHPSWQDLPYGRRTIIHMALASSHIQALERMLLRRGVRILAADRHLCADCGRTPLVGERVHMYEPRHAIVCELCRPARRETPASTEVVRHFELGHTVRVSAHAA